MTEIAPNIYIPGGALPYDALSYVRRRSDDALYAALQRNEFCYILTPRQMGKSSLVAHIARDLREADVTVAVLDLSAIGYNLTAEQWYTDLLDRLGRTVKLETEMEDFCLAHEHLGPLQMWQQALRGVLLEKIPGNIVIFLDEIDIASSLPFSTDEFFAAIRACYNARPHDPAYNRLSFCLLGVARPSDLISNPRLTPFNVGTRIQLHDFTLEEASQLQFGLGRDEITNRLLMKRIHYWTGGHPCLTQRLCKAVAESPSLFTEQGVDDCCRQLLLAPSAESRDDNLTFVQQRLLEGDEEEKAALLTLYRQVLDGKQVADTETIAFVGRLKLSGIVRADNGTLHVRNRIYRHVFDRAWISEHMPGAELRRQRAAFRKGVMRATLLACAVIVPISLFAVLFRLQYLRAESEKIRAQQAEEKVRKNLYVADTFKAQRKWEDGNTASMVNLLEAHKPSKEDPKDRRGFEWWYLWRLAHRERLLLGGPNGHTGSVYSVAYSPDGKLVASGGFDGRVILWDARMGRKISEFQSLKHWIEDIAFSPNGATIAAAVNNSGGDDPNPSMIVFLNTATMQEQKSHRITLPGQYFVGLRYNHSGRILAARAFDDANSTHGSLLAWDVLTGQSLHKWPIQTAGDGTQLAFSPDDRRLACADSKRRIVLLNTATWQKLNYLYVPAEGSSWNETIIFSPDGKWIAAANDVGNVYIWDAAHPFLSPRPLTGPKAECVGLSFSPNGKLLAGGSWDGNIYLWNFPERGKPVIVRGHTNRVSEVAFSPDRKTLILASASSDKTVRLWNVHDLLKPSDDPEFSQLKNDYAVISPGGNVIATEKGRQIQVWDTRTLQPRHTLTLTATSRPNFLSISEDGNRVYGRSKVWDMVTGRLHENLSDSEYDWPGALSHDGKTLAFSSNNRTVAVWNLALHKRTPIPLYLGSPEPTVIVKIAFSPDDSLLAYGWEGHGMNRVRVWNLHTNREVAEFDRSQDNTPTSLAFSSDGRLLACAFWSGAIVVWDITNPSQPPVAELHGHNPYASSVAFSPDGKTMATLGSNDKTIILWNVAIWQEVARFPVKGQGSRVTFTPDGNSLIAVTNEEIYRWNAASRTSLEGSTATHAQP